MEQRFGFTDPKDKDQKYQVENSVRDRIEYKLRLQIRIENYDFSFFLFPWTIRCRLCDHIH